MLELNQTPWTENLPTPVSVQAFNSQLAKLFGRDTRSGQQWVRLLWAATDMVDKFGQPDACDWDCYGDGGRGQWRRRYLYSSDVSYVDRYDAQRDLWYSHEVWNDVSPPRFVIERLVAPVEACRGWQASGVDSDGTPWSDIKPLHGRYEALMIPFPLHLALPLIGSGMIATHNGHCCRSAKADNVQCYGQYAEPSEQHLDEFRMLAYLLNQAPERRPGALTEQEAKRARKRQWERNANAWQSIGDRIQQIALEALRTHAPTFSNDESVVRNGKYHWMSAHNKSGSPKSLIPPS